MSALPLAAGGNTEGSDRGNARVRAPPYEHNCPNWGDDQEDDDDRNRWSQFNLDHEPKLIFPSSMVEIHEDGICTTGGKGKVLARPCLLGVFLARLKTEVRIHKSCTVFKAASLALEFEAKVGC
ncbi:hypothetical protein LIER_15367 [Lithospermum erythrorhizon]|uniref:Uncharacterized protein n=1 Tax=Lithospermum erythrorhizon TaxID=34254 RepID=A0AAV3Q457_LITER